MSKKRYFDTNFWSDTWVETLSQDEKLFFIYLFTNERVTIAGVYEIPLKRMVMESEFDKQSIVAMLSKMESRVRYVNGWIVLRNAIKSQNYKNDKISRGIKAILEACPVELLEFLSFPQDLDIIVERSEAEPTQQRLFDDSSVSQNDSYMSHDKYNVIKYNININSNTNAEQPGKPSVSAAGGSKEPTEKQKKRRYAMAVEADRRLDAKVSKSNLRSPSAPQPIGSTKRERQLRGEE